MFKKFIHPTAAQAMRFASIFLAIGNTILATGATLTGVPASLAGFTVYWPAIYGLALVLHQAASTFGISPDANAADQITAAISEGKQVIAAMTAVGKAVPAANKILNIDPLPDPPARTGTLA